MTGYTLFREAIQHGEGGRSPAPPAAGESTTGKGPWGGSPGLPTYNIIIAGVGGLGVVSAAELLARAAVSQGLDLRMHGSYGMAQRGGSVSVHLRLGERVLNARVERGEADLLIGMELVETVRWAPHLAESGRLLCHEGLVPPAGKVLKDGGARHREFLRALPGALVFDAEKLAGPAGARGSSAVLLGAASALPGFPVGAERIAAELERDHLPRAGPFLEAFRRGREVPR